MMMPTVIKKELTHPPPLAPDQGCPQPEALILSQCVDTRVKIRQDESSGISHACFIAYFRPHLQLDLCSAPAIAASCGKTSAGFDGFKQAVLQEAQAQGIGEEALGVLRAAQYDASVIKRDRAQNVFSQSFLQFQGRMVTNYRIKQGAALIRKHKTVFDAVERKYGVPAPVITAFWALETDFGGQCR